MPLQSLPDSHQYTTLAPVSKVVAKTKRSNKVLTVESKTAMTGAINARDARSNKVLPRKRRSPSKDRQAIENICAFGQRAGSSSNPSSVATSTPPTTPSLSPHTSASINAINYRLPQWEHTKEAAKAFAAIVALLTSGKPAYAFSFNLTPDATAKLMRDPSRFLESLKRALDRELKRRGIDLPNYILGVDQDWDKRLHLHGAFGDVPPELLPVIRTAMKKAWGEWKSPKQLKIEPLYNGGRKGWGDYITKNARRVTKVIGKTVTTTDPLSLEAHAAYDRLRAIISDASMLIDAGWAKDDLEAMEVIDMGNGLLPPS